jgi:hypothetical protein
VNQKKATDVKKIGSLQGTGHIVAAGGETFTKKTAHLSGGKAAACAAQQLSANLYTARLTCLHDFPPLNDANQHHDDGDNKQNMDEATHGVCRHQTQQPQHDQDHTYCPQHNVLLVKQRVAVRFSRCFSMLLKTQGDEPVGAGHHALRGCVAAI